ncbi:Alpha-galactosidase [Podosphaera aphanis]|nr:Alpha-galactosidase [Podosphaera aphanis]
MCLSSYIIAIASILGISVNAVKNGLAITPQMGWNNWNALKCDVSEELLLETARLMVSYGLKDLGYHYIVLDDCWSKGRNASNHDSLIPDLEKFPRGMAPIADELHALDLGFGIYSDAGKYTCAGYDGSLGYEEIDAQTWASWGVDYLKYDNCFNTGYAGTQKISAQRYNIMAKALNATGRPILYSICSWGEDSVWNWASTMANSWRITGDIYAFWDRPDARCPCDGNSALDCRVTGLGCSITNIMNKAAFIVSKPEPGGWNDLDMLEVGNGVLSDAENIAHFSMWSVAKSPLIMGNDLRTLNPRDLSILSNPAVIAVNQDSLGKSAVRRWVDPLSPWTTAGALQLWSGKLASTTGGDLNDMVVLLINGRNEKLRVNATMNDVFLDSPKNNQKWEIRDLWTGRISEDIALGLINSTGKDNNHNSMDRYNATKVSYKDGLVAADERLLGSVIGFATMDDILSYDVDAHGARLFRLRATSLMSELDEL